MKKNEEQADWASLPRVTGMDHSRHLREAQLQAARMPKVTADRSTIERGEIGSFTTLFSGRVYSRNLAKVALDFLPVTAKYAPTQTFDRE